jgi:hypothetical protein
LPLGYKEGKKVLKHRMFNRILYRMKVTTLLPDALIEDICNLAKGKTLTESLITALSSWAKQQKLIQLTHELKVKPFTFKHGFSALKLRELNRSR